jgi:hypothetical protein
VTTAPYGLPPRHQIDHHPTHIVVRDMALLHSAAVTRHLHIGNP